MNQSWGNKNDRLKSGVKTRDSERAKKIPAKTMLELKTNCAWSKTNQERRRQAGSKEKRGKAGEELWI